MKRNLFYAIGLFLFTIVGLFVFCKISENNQKHHLKVEDIPKEQSVDDYVIME